MASLAGVSGISGVKTSRHSETHGAATFWQHPFVDVFKTFNVDAAERRGDVSEELDKQICKRVFRIRGAVSANNFIRLPHAKGSAKSLGLTGEYIYLQLRDLGLKFFVVHLDFTVAVVNVLRITLSNMHSEVKMASRSVLCPCHLMNSWAMVCVHVPSVLKMCTRLPPHAFVLKSIQLCASQYVRNIYTSDIRYTPESMPREMLFDLEYKTFDERYAWIDVPGPFAKEMEPVGSSLGIGWSPQPSSPPMPLQSSNGTHKGGKLNVSIPRPGQDVSMNDASSIVDSVSVAEGASATLSPTSKTDRILDPMLEVSRVIGVSHKNRRIVGEKDVVPRRFAMFVRGPPANGFNSSVLIGCEKDLTFCVLYACSLALVLVDPATQSHRYFFGHSKAIELVEASDDGQWVVSAQGAAGGAPPLLRVWRVEMQRVGLHCASVLSCPSLSAVRVASFDPQSKYMVLGGVDLHNRQQLMVWDISRVGNGGNIALYARQTSADWDLDCVKFSPFNELHIVTCGHENIRYWRVKDGHLPGRNVVLDSLARQTHFTSIAFEFNKMGKPYFLGEHLADHRRFYVGTATGKVLQVSYKDLKVQIVYQLHNAGITSMCANEGFVVTASADGYVRVWPLDFKSFYLHAMHETPVVGVDITVDGLQILCCTADGSVGALDMQDHAYTEVVKSHVAAIADAAVSHFYQELVTVSCDGTVKVWSLKTMAQTYEFAVADDVPLVVAFHPGDKHVFAVGFKSGAMRVFDVDGPAVLCEHRHHIRPVVSIAFVSDEKSDAARSRALGRVCIITCDTTGSLAIHDEAARYEVVRTPERALCATPPDRCAAIVVAPPRLLQYFDPHTVALCNYPGLELIRRLRVSTSTFTSLGFSVEGRLAVLGAADSQLYVFCAVSGDLITTSSFMSGPIMAAALTQPEQLPPVLLATTADTLIRVLQLRGADLHAVEEGGGTSASTTRRAVSLNEQSFIGHSIAPHRLLLCASCVVTVSSMEVMCWSTSGTYFEALFDELRKGRQAARLEKPIPLDTEVTLKEAVTLHPGETTPADLVTSSPSVENLAETCKDSCAGSSFPNPVRVLDLGTQSSECTSVPNERRVAVAEHQNPQSARDQQPTILDDDLRPVPISITKTKLEFELLGLSGCALQFGRGSFAWQDGCGVLCHTVGSAVYIEELPIARHSGKADGVGHVVAKLPGLEAFALDLAPDGSGSLAVLSGAPSNDGGDVWLSLWCVGSLARHALQKLPETYAAHWSHYRDSLQRLVKMNAPPLLRLLPGGRLAVTVASSSEGATSRVDAWEFIGDGCVLRSCAEIPHQILDISILPESPHGSNHIEFTTLSSRAIVFWQIPNELGPDEGVSPLRCAIADAPEDWSSTGSSRALCIATVTADASCRLLLVGTVGGCIWAYNADENQLIGEVCLEGELSESSADHSDAVEVLASSEWPFLVCSRAGGVTLSAWRVAERPLGSRQFFGVSLGPPTTLDGRICAIRLGLGLGSDTAGALEGIAATSRNTLWYFNASDGTAVPLQRFHAAPSRILRSNATLLEAASAIADGMLETSEALVSGDNDGNLKIWARPSSSIPALPRPVAQLRGVGAGPGGVCTALAFIRVDLFACTFACGSLALCCLSDFSIAATVDVFEKRSPNDSAEPALAVEAMGSDAVIVGSGKGCLMELHFQLERHGRGPRDSWVVRQLRKIRLRGPRPSASVCRIEHDREILPQRFVVCFASLQLWLLESVAGADGGCSSEERGGDRGGGLRHTQTWIWPENDPKPPQAQQCDTPEQSLGMLATPPLVANFAIRSTADSADLVAIAAPPSPCLYIYGCTSGTIVHRIDLNPKLAGLAVRRLLPLAPRPAAAGFGDEDDATVGDGALLVLCADRFARLGLGRDGRHFEWLEHAVQLPGGSMGQLPGLGGMPDACMVLSPPEIQLKGDRQHLIIKSDTALSCWRLREALRD